MLTIPLSGQTATKSVEYAFFTAEPYEAGGVKIHLDNVCWASNPQDIEVPPGGGQFYRPLKRIDWSANAHASSRINIDHPTQADLETIKKSYWEICHCSELHYQTPLDPDLLKGHYYIISSSGITELQPTKLLGSIRYHWNNDLTAIDGRVDHFGYVVANTMGKGNSAGHGFVVFSKTPLQIDSFPANKSLPKEFSSALSTYLFKLGALNASFLFVEWPADTKCQEACCKIRYSLHRIVDGTPSAEKIASIDAQCDV